MKSRWNFTFYKVGLMYCAAIIIGAAIVLLWTRNISLLAGCLEILAMVFLSVSVLISCREKETDQ